MKLCTYIVFIWPYSKLVNSSFCNKCCYFVYLVVIKVTFSMKSSRCKRCRFILTTSFFLTYIPLFSLANTPSEMADLSLQELFALSTDEMDIRTYEAWNFNFLYKRSELDGYLKGDNKMQGNWGELVLERVLEKSGLEKDREYFVQQSFTNDEGKRVLPDVVIHLPGNKKMIVDSKVSLTAYEQYVNGEDEEKERFLKEHVNSLKRHVEQLSEKKYEDIYKIESPDFVLLFVPIEPAFAVALNSDNTLYNKAFAKNIVIVTPTTLLATLRTIDTMWNNEKQQRNAIEISRQAGALYDKFDGLLKDLISDSKKIDDSKTDYNTAMNKLFEGKGNLITSVEKLKKMGAKAKKALPENIIARANEDK